MDYRKLNNVTKNGVHPLPRVDDLLKAVSGSKYFNALAPTTNQLDMHIPRQNLESSKRRSFTLVLKHRMEFLFIPE